MSDDKIEEIRAKLARLTSHVSLVSAEMRRKSDRADEAWAEVERQRAEIERLRQAHQAACEGGDLLRAEIELQRESRRREARAFEAERDRLRANLNTALRERDEALEGKP